MNKFEIASSTTAALSTGACLLIIFAYILKPNIRVLLHSKIVLLNAAVNLLFSITAFYPHIPGIFNHYGVNSLCCIFGFVREFSLMLSLLATALFTRILYKLSKQQDTNLERFTLVFTLGSIIVAAIISIYPLIKTRYGKYDSFCWLDDSLPESDLLLTLLLQLYIPLALVFVHNTIITLLVAFDLRKRESRPSNRVLQLLLFPAALLICFSGEIADRMYRLSSQSRSPEWLRFAGIIGVQALGLINVILYSLNQQGRAILSNYCRQTTRLEANLNESILVSRAVSRSNTGSSAGNFKLM